MWMGIRPQHSLEVSRRAMVRVHLYKGDGTSLIVCDECMFAHGIALRTSDDHAIVDIDTGQ